VVWCTGYSDAGIIASAISPLLGFYGRCSYSTLPSALNCILCCLSTSRPITTHYHQATAPLTLSSTWRSQSPRVLYAKSRPPAFPCRSSKASSCAWLCCECAACRVGVRGRFLVATQVSRVPECRCYWAIGADEGGPAAKGHPPRFPSPHACPMSYFSFAAAHYCLLLSVEIPTPKYLLRTEYPQHTSFLRPAPTGPAVLRTYG
jgi:hypothetical protein